MTKIVDVKHIDQYKLELIFSTGEKGVLDFNYLFEKKTELTKRLQDLNYFKDFFLELGALCWKNGLEISPKTLYEKLSKNNLLVKIKKTA